jgi:hypothetical protein
MKCPRRRKLPVRENCPPNLNCPDSPSPFSLNLSSLFRSPLRWSFLPGSLCPRRHNRKTDPFGVLKPY